MQSGNITELGELKATNLIVNHFNELQRQPADTALISSIRKDISEVMRLNMEAINRKSDIADETALKAIIIISDRSVLFFDCFHSIDKSTIQHLQPNQGNDRKYKGNRSTELPQARAFRKP